VPFWWFDAGALFFLLQLAAISEVAGLPAANPWTTSSPGAGDPGACSNA
jgi:hypothetical protein